MVGYMDMVVLAVDDCDFRYLVSHVYSYFIHYVDDIIDDNAILNLICTIARKIN